MALSTSTHRNAHWCFNNNLQCLVTKENGVCRYFSVLPIGSQYYLARPDNTVPTNLASVVGQAYQAQPGSSEDKALYQVSHTQKHGYASCAVM